MNNSSTRTLRPIEKDLEDNWSILRGATKCWPAEVPPRDVLTQMFYDWDLTLSCTVSKTDNNTARRDWADGEARKLRRMVGYLRQLCRKCGGSRSKARASRGREWSRQADALSIRACHVML